MSARVGSVHRRIRILKSRGPFPFLTYLSLSFLPLSFPSSPSPSPPMSFPVLFSIPTSYHFRQSIRTVPRSV